MADPEWQVIAYPPPEIGKPFAVVTVMAGRLAVTELSDTREQAETLRAQKLELLSLAKKGKR